MAQALRRFIPRAPRYVFRPDEERLVRFASHDDHSHLVTTKIVDISVSGLAFTIEQDFAPSVGDLIKVEFPLPGTDQTAAWWGRVVRLEDAQNSWWSDEHAAEHIIVGIQFHRLPTEHKILIKQILDDKFAELITERYRSRLIRSFKFFTYHFWKILMYGVCIAITFGFLWYFSQPTATYTAERGSPWGHRYSFSYWGK